MYTRYLNYWRDLAAVLPQSPAALGKSFDRFVPLSGNGLPQDRGSVANWQGMTGAALDFLSTESLLKVWLHYRAAIPEDENIAQQERRNVLLHAVMGSVRRNPWMREAITSVQTLKWSPLSWEEKQRALEKPLPLDVLESAFQFANGAEQAMHNRNADQVRKDPAFLYGLFTHIVGQTERHPGIGVWAKVQSETQETAQGPSKKTQEALSSDDFTQRLMAWEKNANGLLGRLSLPELKTVWEAYYNTDCQQPGINEHNLFFVQRTIEVFAGYHPAVAPYVITYKGMDEYYCDPRINHLAREIWSVESFPDSLNVALNEQASKPGRHHPPHSRFLSHVLKPD